MKATMLTALLGLCAALVPREQDVALRDFDLVKFSGFWYEIAFTAELQGSPTKLRKMGAVLVEPEEGHLALTTSYEDEGRCVKDKRLALDGGAPGKFKLPKESGDKEISVLDTDYQTFAVLDVTLHQGEQSHRALKLYSRRPDHNEEAMGRLRQVAQEHGFSSWDVHQLSGDMTCVNLLLPGGVPSS